MSRATPGMVDPVVPGPEVRTPPPAPPCGAGCRTNIMCVYNLEFEASPRILFPFFLSSR
jgi:hypothetical protein